MAVHIWTEEAGGYYDVPDDAPPPHERRVARGRPLGSPVVGRPAAQPEVTGDDVLERESA